MDDTESNVTNLLDGYRHIYLDMETNVVVHIRKAFEQHKFQGSLALPIFNQYFGKPETRALCQICALGFEPNPAHSEELARLEGAYKKCGWNVQIYKESGVASRNNVAYFSKVNNVPLALGGRLVDKDDNFVNTVKSEFYTL